MLCGCQIIIIFLAWDCSPFLPKDDQTVLRNTVLSHRALGKVFFKIILWGCVKGDLFLFCGTVCGLSIDCGGLISLFSVDCYWTILCVV